MYKIYDLRLFDDEEIFKHDNLRECLFYVQGYIKGSECRCELVIKDENGKIEFIQGLPPEKY